jgi:SAM-dependent methyltransferase
MPTAETQQPAGEGGFRFYDNRQKYLLFVNTCSEKWVIAERIGSELAGIEPRQPAIRFFDAGIGDGTVLARTIRKLHQRFERVPFYIAGKEISLEDVRLFLDKVPDRLFEHPETVIAVTNMSYARAPWLWPASEEDRRRLVWKEAALTGSTAAEFETQIQDLQGFLGETWTTAVDDRTGRLVPETPAVLVLYREDCRFLLDRVIPRRGKAEADFDFVLASQPYRLRAPIEFKARNILAPLARSLRTGGVLLGIHSAGGDPGMEIIRRVWPGEDPFVTSRHELVEATRSALVGMVGAEAADGYACDPLPAARSLFRYDMHTLPDEIGREAVSIGTSTLLAAWNAAVYVAQVDDARVTEAMTGPEYLDATRAVLKKHGELWFNDESYVIRRLP